MKVSLKKKKKKDVAFSLVVNHVLVLLRGRFCIVWSSLIKMWSSNMRERERCSLRLKVANVQLWLLKQYIQRCHRPGIFKVWTTAVIITHRYFQIRIYRNSYLISNQENNLLSTHHRGQLWYKYRFIWKNRYHNTSLGLLLEDLLMMLWFSSCQGLQWDIRKN